MPESNQLAVQSEQPAFVRASTALSEQLGLEPRAMIDAIKAQFFKGKEVTDAQLAVVVSTARELGLNPLLPGQLYPYPDRGATDDQIRQHSDEPGVVEVLGGARFSGDLVAVHPRLCRGSEVHHSHRGGE